MKKRSYIAIAAVIAGGIASISGFGIGSILTPLLASALGTKLAVAVVSVPHLVGTALRFSFIYRHVNRRVLLSFGIASAIGGLTGALLHVWLRSVWLGYILGVLLVFAERRQVVQKTESAMCRPEKKRR